MDFSDPQPYPPNMMIMDPNPFPNTFTPSKMMIPNTARFPLTNYNILPHSDPYNNNNNINNNNNNSINNESPKPCIVASGSFKRKRGRPRKHSPPDGDTSLALASTHMVSSSYVKKSRGRGRPLGSRKKQLNALGGPAATNFTPHVLFVKPGEDVAAKIMAFCEQARRTIIILSANGKVGNVTLRHTTRDEGVVTYEGFYELISMSRSFSLPENNSGGTRMSELSVSLGGLDGTVIGGGLVGKLTTTSTVQVVVSSFLEERKKSSSKNMNFRPSSASPSEILTFGASLNPTSPTSQGPSTVSFNDNEKGTFSDESGLYNNISHPIHTFPKYLSNMGCPNSAVAMSLRLS